MPDNGKLIAEMPHCPSENDPYPDKFAVCPNGGVLYGRPREKTWGIKPCALMLSDVPTNRQIDRRVQRPACGPLGGPCPVPV